MAEESCLLQREITSSSADSRCFKVFGFSTRVKHHANNSNVSCVQHQHLPTVQKSTPFEIFESQLVHPQWCRVSIFFYFTLLQVHQFFGDTTWSEKDSRPYQDTMHSSWDSEAPPTLWTLQGSSPIRPRSGPRLPSPSWGWGAAVSALWLWSSEGSEQKVIIFANWTGEYIICEVSLTLFLVSAHLAQLHWKLIQTMHTSPADTSTDVHTHLRRCAFPPCRSAGGRAQRGAAASGGPGPGPPSAGASCSEMPGTEPGEGVDLGEKNEGKKLRWRLFPEPQGAFCMSRRRWRRRSRKPW